LLPRKGNAAPRFRQSNRWFGNCVAAHGAQQNKSTRRVAALMPNSVNDPQAQNRNAAFLQALQ
jgi:hypothetical protein